MGCNPLTRNGREAPIPTSPRRKSGLPDLRITLRNPGKPGLRGEVDRGRKLSLHKTITID